MNAITPAEPHRHTMERLEAAKRITPEGVEYWVARELGPILGYLVWQNFEPVIERAAEALRATGIDPSHQIMLTHKMMARAGGGPATGRDYWVTRAASYLIAMNGESSKPEIAAAQIYFAVKTRQMEMVEQDDVISADEKRLELRDKVAGAARRVSSAAKDAGVQNKRQGIFHDQRWRGLYGASGAQVKAAKGLKATENLLDHADHLELSAHEFQMNLAANALVNERVRTEQAAFNKNLEIAKHVRRTIEQSGGTLPELLPLAPEHIGDVRKRVTGRKTKALAKPKGSNA